MTQQTLARPDTPDRSFPAVAFPGGYSILYFTADGGVLCASCANCKEARQAEIDCPDDEQWRIVFQWARWEGSSLNCDNCNRELPSEYGDPDSDQ